MDGGTTESNGDVHDVAREETSIEISPSESNGVDNKGYSTDYIIDTVPNKNGTAVNNNKDNER